MSRVLLDAVWPFLILLRAVVALAARVPGAALHLPAPPALAVAAYGLALALALTWWRLRRARSSPRPGADPPASSGRPTRLLGIAALVGAALAVALAVWPLVAPRTGRLRVTVLDVGQGDAIVIEGPNGRTVLIDAGAAGPTRMDVGERVVAPFLWNRGVLRLAGTVVTHEDADHAGGMAAIRRLLRPGPAWSGEDLRTAPPALGGALLSVLPEPRGLRSRNEAALALRLEYGLASFLLTSDIGAATEAEWLARGAPLAASVLKVGHHGSRTSSTTPFLAAVRPAVAVISVGARNPYGHPHPAALARLAASGARVLRTDRDGAVIFETDGRRLDVTRWADRRVERYCLDPETSC